MEDTVFLWRGGGGGGANAPGGFGPEFGNITMMDIAYISICIVEIGCLKPKYVLESHTSLYVCMQNMCSIPSIQSQNILFHNTESTFTTVYKMYAHR